MNEQIEENDSNAKGSNTRGNQNNANYFTGTQTNQLFQDGVPEF